MRGEMQMKDHETNQGRHFHSHCWGGSFRHREHNLPWEAAAVFVTFLLCIVSLVLPPPQLMWDFSSSWKRPMDNVQSGCFMLINLRKEVRDLANWIVCPMSLYHSLSLFLQLLRINESLLKHSHSDPRERHVDGLFISQLTLWRMPEEKQTLMLGELLRGEECFHLSGSLDPQLAISEIDF